MLRKIFRFIKRKIKTEKDFKIFKNFIKNTCRYIVLISNNADGAGGAPAVLYEYAKYLKEKGCNVIFLTGKGGNLFSNAKEDNINIFLMENKYKKYIKKLKKLKIDYIIVNTLLGYNYIKEFQKNKINNVRIIWWIHEEKKIIKKYKNKIPQKINDNIKIMCVSDRIKNNMQSEVKNNINYGVMYYGCRDMFLNSEYVNYIQNNLKKEEKKYLISVIGRICKRKNQIQVIEAYNLIDEKTRNKIKINFVAGSYEKEYMQKIKEKINNMKNINIIGPINRKDMYKIYADSDLIICSSIDDPLPVVVTEAMMYKTPFITSTETGQSELINNGVNGIVYDVNSTEDLKKQILKCYFKEYNKNMEENERKIFLEKFSLEHLKKEIDLIDIEV